MGGYAKCATENNTDAHAEAAPDAAAAAAAAATVVGGTRRSRGIFVQFYTIVIALVLAVCMAVAVGLIVYFLTACTSRFGEDSSNGTAIKTEKSPQSKKLVNLRLPDAVKPFHYDLTLAPFIYSANASEFYFSGAVSILLNVTQSTDSVMLHADAIHLNESNLSVVDVSNDKPCEVKSIVYSEEAQWYHIQLKEKMKKDQPYRIEIHRFSKPLLLDLRGLYYSKYTESGQVKYLVASQLQPTDARKTFPCFDEPSFKATFNVSLVRKKYFKSISNMMSNSVVNIDGSVWFHNANAGDEWEMESFHITPKMSTYLLAFVVSQFKWQEDTDSKGRLYRNWVRPEFNNITGYAMRSVINFTEFFEAYFNVTFPLKKTDQVAIPDFNAGGMENWGLITYRESRLPFDENKDTSASLQSIGNVIAHEVSHMWFGNLVTPQWWDDIWLNEGFASFTQILGIRHKHPNWDIDAQFVATSQEVAFEVDSKGSSHPIYMEVQNPNQINQIFDYITYRKAATVLRMLYYFVGDTVFRQAIGSYLENNSYSSTFHTSLYESLTKKAREYGHNLDVGEVMDRWIKQMGYPVINCSRSDNILRLTQNHFLSDPTQTPNPRFVSEYNYTWIVPITMATNKNISNLQAKNMTPIIQWMRLKKQTFSMDSTDYQWYLLNLMSAGFYRVNYDAENWRAITMQLQKNHSVFTPQDRARLIDDGFSLAESGYIDYSIPLNITKYLEKETHTVPWRMALTKLTLLHVMLNGRSQEYGAFSSYMRRLLMPAYKEVGLKPKSGDTHLKKMHRSLIVSSACRYRLNNFSLEAIEIFREVIKANSTRHMAPDVRRRILCEGIASTGADAWDRLYDIGQRVPHPGVKTDITKALSCSRQPWILSRYLNFALNPDKVRRQDAATVFLSVSRNPIGLPIVWDYIQSNWQMIHDTIPGSFTTSYFISAVSDFNTQLRLDEMLAFKKKYKDALGSAERALDQTIETVRLNIRWMREMLPAVRSWLRDNAQYNIR